MIWGRNALQPKPLTWKQWLLKVLFGILWFIAAAIILIVVALFCFTSDPLFLIGILFWH